MRLDENGVLVKVRHEINWNNKGTAMRKGMPPSIGDVSRDYVLRLLAHGGFVPDPSSSVDSNFARRETLLKLPLWKGALLG